MLVLGLHKDLWHDTGAALIRGGDGKTEYVMRSEERMDRVKNSRAFPQKSIDACLNEFGVKGISKIDLVVLDYICNSDWKNDQYKTPCRRGMMLEQLPTEKIRVMNHHLAHIPLSFFVSSG